MNNRCSFVTSRGACRRKTKTDLCWQHTPLNICCAICIENVGRCKKFTLSCDHTFHRQCISKWVKKGNDTCPYCRHVVSGYELCVLGGKRYEDPIKVEFNIEDIEVIIALLEILL